MRRKTRGRLVVDYRGEGEVMRVISSFYVSKIPKLMEFKVRYPNTDTHHAEVLLANNEFHHPVAFLHARGMGSNRLFLVPMAYVRTAKTEDLMNTTLRYGACGVA